MKKSGTIGQQNIFFLQLRQYYHCSSYRERAYKREDRDYFSSQTNKFNIDHAYCLYHSILSTSKPAVKGTFSYPIICVGTMNFNSLHLVILMESIVNTNYCMWQINTRKVTQNYTLCAFMNIYRYRKYMRQNAGITDFI